MRMTKQQIKDNARIQAWLEGKEFRENSRAKPAVPNLSHNDVLEDWTPPCVSAMGQFFTPYSMVEKLHPWTHGRDARSGPYTVLDPCAGIGHLLTDFSHSVYQVTAIEMQWETFTLGQHLFPAFEWRQWNALEYLDTFEGQFDIVICNPPYNITVGMHNRLEGFESGGKKSHQLFLELCVRALRPDRHSIAVMIGPYNLITGLPKKAAAWFEENAQIVDIVGPLHGEFKHTKMQVHAYMIKRKEN